VCWVSSWTGHGLPVSPGSHVSLVQSMSAARVSPSSVLSAALRDANAGRVPIGAGAEFHVPLNLPRIRRILRLFS
jgi:hypothetical protein